MKSTVSVIVPVYNVAPYLNKCLDSILGQTYKELEVIVVDDGSKDEGLRICREYESRDERVKVLHQENAGVSAARNFGMSIMTGSYVLFVDADDWIEPNMVEILVHEMEQKESVDAVFCGYQEIEDGTNKLLQTVTPNQRGQVRRDEGVEGLFGEYSTMLWNKLFRTSLIDQTNIFNTSLKIGEDELWMIEVLKKARNIVLLGAPLYNYRYRSAGASKDVWISDARMTDYESQKMVLESIGDYHSDELTLCAQKRLYYVGQRIMKAAYYSGRYDIYEMIDREIDDVRTVWYKHHSNKLGKIRRRLVEKMMRKRFPCAIIKIFDK
ncbi:glycosyltransferase family 2 protein [Blautia sp. MSJ-19]|uniref:glycosyltransferase family 2 protein n=1 Tax=Blautia sp. MSJ-19 TaxID=2841517 RepID=UPI001C0F0A7D|nr:glycosyltransferase family 2 protein [Blautia sp. MSJ-19]